MKVKLPFYLSQDVNEKVANDLDFAKFVLNSIKRHFKNDFSECGKEDEKLNNDTLINGSRIFNVFHFNDKVKIWIITEAEPYRDITTVLFPKEY
jgi:hypothetical protein